MILGSFRGPKSMQNEVRKRLGNRIVNKRAQDRRKIAPRRRKMPQGFQVGADLDPRGVQKSIQNRSKFDLGRPRGRQSYLRCSRGALGKENDTKIEEKTINFDAEDMQKRRASRFVFQRFWVGKSEAQYQKRASIPSFFC